VRDYLVQQGILPAAIAFGAVGKTRPVASNDTAEATADRAWNWC